MNSKNVYNPPYEEHGASCPAILDAVFGLEHQEGIFGHGPSG